MDRRPISGPRAHKMRRLSRMAVPGGGQVVVQGSHAYIGHMDPPHGTSIIDVSDPRQPRLVSKIDLPEGSSHSHKVRVVADHLMIVNSEQNRRRLFRMGRQIPALFTAWRERHGRRPTDAELAAALGVPERDVPLLIEAERRGYRDGGFRIYDIADRSRPRELCFQRTGGCGVHRFAADGRYAYISTEMEGYEGNILVIYDIGDPERPREVSRWCLEGQKRDEGKGPAAGAARTNIHHALRWRDQLWAGCWHDGFRVIDVSEIARPRTVGACNYHPPFPKPTHTALRVPFPVAGREIALVIDEEIGTHCPGQPHAFLWVYDVADLQDMKPLATFHVSEADSPWSRVPGYRFGAHQFQERLEGTLVFAAWFSGGLRVIDIADPTLPREVGFFIPEPEPPFLAPQSNDVDLDDRGLIYLIDRHSGLDILEFTG